MKKIHVRLLFTIIAIAVFPLAACNDKPRQSSQANNAPATSDTTVYKAQIPNSTCYLHTSGKDTVRLKVEVFPNVVTGRLQYDFYQKDDNKGDIDGRLSGDTLIADYSFISEGRHSIRQVAFLIKDSVVIEGYADMKEENGKMVFKNTNQLNFSKGLILNKIPCGEY